MPKLKTRKGVLKRFKITKKGKIKRRRAFKSHKLSHKSRKRKLRLLRADLVHKTDVEKIKKALPYY